MTKPKKTKTNLIVASGQYEMSAITITVTHTTENGLMRRARQLSKEHSVYGDNWEGWINARVAIASDDDVWGDNQIIRSQGCSPANGWLNLWDDEDC